MSAETVELVQSAGVEHRSSFFRQSGWMMVTTVGSGVLMALVHIFSKFIPDAEYAAFGTLLQFLNWITIPAIGLQVTFAQQTSSVTTLAAKQQLAGTVRAVVGGTFAIWIIIATICFIYQPQLLRSLKIANPTALWVTVLLGLVMLWLPITFGLLQGRQNFLWLGWASVFNGGGRILLAGVIVLLLGGWAAGIMTGALLGAIVALAIGMWHNRDLFNSPAERFDSAAWLRRVVPLSLACGASLFLFSADLIAVQTHLSGAVNTAPYVFGGTLARALVIFTAPLISVMFPKIVHSAVRKKESDLMLLTLGLTLVLVLIGVAGLALGGPLLIQLGSKKAYVSFVPLLPIFAFSMAPLALGNVLLNNLMAHSRFQCVPALLAVAAGYWIALQQYHDSFLTVIRVLGVFNLLFLAVCAFFTWAGPVSAKLRLTQLDNDYHAAPAIDWPRSHGQSHAAPFDDGANHLSKTASRGPRYSRCPGYPGRLAQPTRDTLLLIDRVRGPPRLRNSPSPCSPSPASASTPPTMALTALLKALASLCSRWPRASRPASACLSAHASAHLPGRPTASISPSPFTGLTALSSGPPMP